MAETIAWIQERVPAWLLILMAGIGTPTSIGNVIWNQNSELQMQVLREDLDRLEAAHGMIWHEMSLRVRVTERLEMKAELERRMTFMENRLDRLMGIDGFGKR